MVVIETYKQLDKGGLVAFFAANCGPVTICDIRLLRSSKDGSLFIGMPSREYQGRDGKKCYADIVKVSRELSAEILKAVLAHAKLEEADIDPVGQAFPSEPSSTPPASEETPF